jgi:hypothetical protein
MAFFAVRAPRELSGSLCWTGVDEVTPSGAVIAKGVGPGLQKRLCSEGPSGEEKAVFSRPQRGSLVFDSENDGGCLGASVVHAALHGGLARQPADVRRDVQAVVVGHQIAPQRFHPSDVVSHSYSVDLDPGPFLSRIHRDDAGIHSSCSVENGVSEQADLLGRRGRVS